MLKLTKIAYAAGALALAPMSAALAADLPEPVPVPLPAVGGWYLRGDIGFSNQQVDHLFNSTYDAFADVDTVSKSFDSAPTFGVGVGYRWNHWLRTDVTGEYRANASFDGLDVATGPQFPGPFPDPFTDTYTAKKHEWVALANVYADLGTYYGLTPFVGAGAGGTRTTISDFTDVGASTLPGSGGTGSNRSTWDFAWALYAGLAYDITPALTMELAYRYLNLGDAKSGDLKQFDGTNTVNNPMEFHDLSSHDVKVGFRYQFK